MTDTANKTAVLAVRSVPLVGDEPAMRDWAAELVAQARAEGLELTGDNGLLTGLVRQVLQTGLEVEMTDHLGYERHAAAGRGSGNSRNGMTSKTVTTEVGKVELRVPRDRDGSFDPQTVRKGQRRLDGLTGNVISLYAKGMTTGDIQAHLADVYDTDISRDTISRITDAVIEDLLAWQNRPLDRGLVSRDGCERSREDVRMPRWAHNKLPSSVRQRYFELIRSGLKGSEAARRVGVSTSCGSLWFIDAGRMAITRATLDLAALPDPGRSDRHRRRARRQDPGQGDRRRDRQDVPDRLSRDRPWHQA